MTSVYNRYINSMLIIIYFFGIDNLIKYYIATDLATIRVTCNNVWTKNSVFDSSLKKVGYFCWIPRLKMEIAPLLVVKSSKDISLKQTYKSVRNFQTKLGSDVNESGSVIFKAFDNANTVDAAAASNRNAMDDASAKLLLICQELKSFQKDLKTAENTNATVEPSLLGSDIHAIMKLSDNTADASSAKKKKRRTD